MSFRAILVEIALNSKGKGIIGDLGRLLLELPLVFWLPEPPPFDTLPGSCFIQTSHITGLCPNQILHNDCLKMRTSSGTIKLTFEGEPLGPSKVSSKASCLLWVVGRVFTAQILHVIQFQILQKTNVMIEIQIPIYISHEYLTGPLGWWSMFTTPRGHKVTHVDPYLTYRGRFRYPNSWSSARSICCLPFNASSVDFYGNYRRKNKL